MYTAVHPWQVSISVTIQVLADDDEPKEREVVGRQRHSSVWASLVRWGRVEGVGAGGRVVMMVVEILVELVMVGVVCGGLDLVNWNEGLDLLPSGENSKSGKKYSHLNFPSKHK